MFSKILKNYVNSYSSILINPKHYIYNDTAEHVKQTPESS